MRVVRTIHDGKLPYCHDKSKEKGANSIIMCENSKCPINYQCGFFEREVRIEKVASRGYTK